MCTVSQVTAATHAHMGLHAHRVFRLHRNFSIKMLSAATVAVLGLRLQQPVISPRLQPVVPPRLQHPVVSPRSPQGRREVLGFALASLLPRAIPAHALEVGDEVVIDADYPGTAVARMGAIRERARSLTRADLSGDWETVRTTKILWAAGMKDLPLASPGQGFTGHAFNDAIHVDATAMLGEVEDNRNDGSVRGISVGNRLGPGIQIASVPELGSGGSWSTCQLDARSGRLDDVAHGQFQARIAFKLVWCAPDYRTFVLLDDDGQLLASGTPRGELPPLSERERNFEMVRGTKYATPWASHGELFSL